MHAAAREGNGGGEGEANQQGGGDGFLAQIQQELLQGHRLVVDADYEVAQLRQEELDVLVGELAELGAQHIVDADVVRVTSGRARMGQWMKARGGGGDGWLAGAHTFTRAHTRSRARARRPGSAREGEGLTIDRRRRGRGSG